MKPFNTLEVWFVTGSQNLYGEETLRQVAADSQIVARRSTSRRRCRSTSSSSRW